LGFFVSVESWEVYVDLMDESLLGGLLGCGRLAEVRFSSPVRAPFRPRASACDKQEFMGCAVRSARLVSLDLLGSLRRPRLSLRWGSSLGLRVWSRRHLPVRLSLED